MERIGGMALARPRRRSRRPLRRAQRLLRLLPVSAERRRELVLSVAVERFERVGSGGVFAGEALAQLRAVGDLLGEGMLEGVPRLGVERPLVDELGRRQRRERGRQFPLRNAGHSPKDGLGELPADHGGALQHRLRIIRQPVDPGGQHGLHAGGDLDLVDRVAEPVGAPTPRKGPALHEALDDLFDEEGVAAGARRDQFAESVERRVRTNQSAHQTRDRVGTEGDERQLLVVGALSPVGSVLGPEVDHHEGACTRQRVDEIGEESLAARVEPVQVLYHHQAAALAGGGMHEPPPGRKQGPLSRLGRHLLRYGALGVRHAEEVEQDRQRVAERLVQQQQPAGDLGPRRARLVVAGDPEVVPQHLDHRE
jgi:hypothetical protein